MAEVKKLATGKLAELRDGAWPSFVTEIEAAAQDNKTSEALLGVLERSYNEKIGHWKHGGIVGVMGYGGGVIGRYVDIPEDYPDISHFHTIRVNQPGGWFYKADTMREICNIWERHGSGLTNMHGSTGDMVFLGTNTDELEPTFDELTKLGFDLGGSGSVMRTPSCCNGPARCEWAMYDTLKVTYDLTMHYQDELHRPFFPYKFKFKMSGCPNDCVASIARADMSIIGTWRDDIQVNNDRVGQYVSDGLNIQRDVINRCPTSCMEWDGKELNIDNRNCSRCMHCINVMHLALSPGKDRGATILLGSKAPILEGALLSSVLVPFMKMDEPFNDEDANFEDLKDLIDEIWEVWGEEGKNRERIGEFVERIGKSNFLDAIGLEPIPEMVAHPRENPYVFYTLGEDDEGEE
ncbi:MAG: dissimilatory-type sulfite reductase subunit alpha [Calditrichaeota bacterium]|mgnify:CR=1 FL=1|jgi:sulfite reductase alpha subunit|nr:dissimilatory-type sulfite reductase subunit alpha [Calditrichota bacterium]MBT7788700.1 dissimilatory-type sulfite reductase subunit alpha [Calditrichota bacterium]